MPKAAKETKAKAKPAKAVKAKKEKDPNAPKKPSGAYMFFCKDKRNDIKAAHPDWGVTDIGKRLGEMWKETSEGDKKKYYEQAEKDKQRYAKEDAEYKKKH